MRLEHKSFWMVWNPMGNAPTYRHSSENGATQEAERLARANPGQTFVVLQAVAARQASDMVRVQLTSDADIPF